MTYVAVLAGCQTGAVSTEAHFDPRDGTGTGLIVFGLRVTREPEGHSWLIGDYNLNPVYSLHFNAVGPDNKLARPTRQVELCDAGRIILRGALSSCDPRLLQYRVLEVPAGRYVLADFYYSAEHLTAVTRFIDPDPVRLPANAILRGGTLSYVTPARVGEPVAYPQRSFVVNAGEIVSIGELALDASEPSVRISLTRNDAGAQAALRSYRGITGQIVFRPLFGGAPE